MSLAAQIPVDAGELEPWKVRARWVRKARIEAGWTPPSRRILKANMTWLEHQSQWDEDSMRKTLWLSEMGELSSNSRHWDVRACMVWWLTKRLGAGWWREHLSRQSWAPHLEELAKVCGLAPWTYHVEESTIAEVAVFGVS